MDEETNEALIARYKLVKQKVDAQEAKCEKQRRKSQYGAAKDNDSRWLGCLNFNLSMITDKLSERGLKV